MKHARSLALSGAVALLLLSAAAWAGAQAAKPIGPVPPEFQKVKDLPGEDPFWVYRPTFSPDGKLAAGFMHSTHKIVVWDLATGAVVHEVEESVHGMPALDGYEFSLDGKCLILLYRDLPLKFLDFAAKKVVREIPIAADPRKVYDYSFSPDMKLLALATGNGVKVWDVAAGTLYKSFLPGQVVGGLDMHFYKNEKGELVRLIAYGLLLRGAATSFRDVAGIINLDSGAVTTVLNDVPAEKVAAADMMFLWPRFETGAGSLLVAYSAIPPKVKAGVYLVDTRTGKYRTHCELDQLVLSYSLYYLWKPFYGFIVCSKDMMSNPYKTAAEFLVVSREKGLTVMDRTREDVLPVQSLTVSRDHGWALVSCKASQSEPSRVGLFRLVPKKPQ